MAQPFDHIVHNAIIDLRFRARGLDLTIGAVLDTQSTTPERIDAVERALAEAREITSRLLDMSRRLRGVA